MRRKFYWDDWNRDHITKHSVAIAEAEFVVRQARPPYPRNSGDGKWTVRGTTTAGRALQVIFVKRSVADVDYNELALEQIEELQDSSVPFVYIVHARDLTDHEKSKHRR